MTRGTACFIRAVDFGTRFLDATVVHALFIRAALAVGRTPSRNRRTGVARAVGTRNARRVFVLTRGTACFVRAVDFGTRFFGAAVVHAFFRATAVAVRSAVTAGFRTRIARTVRARFDISRRIARLAGRRISHFGTRLLNAGAARQFIAVNTAGARSCRTRTGRAGRRTRIACCGVFGRVQIRTRRAVDADALPVFQSVAVGAFRAGVFTRTGQAV